ncbi:MAG TPA: hypothetical protein VFB62_26260, partial [Polyangiaceae bacterium]|nr:hypothetical protein [Polyangiaceae bacterium]
VKELFWQPYLEQLERNDQKVPLDRTHLPVIPPQCAYLKGESYNPEPPPDAWKKVRRRFKVSTTPREGKVLPYTKEGIDSSVPIENRMMDVNIYDATIGKQTVPILSPKSGPAAGGNHLPTVNEIAKALAVLPPGQLKQVKQVVLTPGLQHNDPPDDDFATVASASCDGRVNFYQSLPTQTQEKIDATMVHESGHTTACALWGKPDDPKFTNDDWEKARAADNNFVSGYAKDHFDKTSSSSEDYAESLVIYSASKGTECEKHARKRYPNRFKFLDKQVGGKPAK